jgi:hypothetical protein
MHISKQRLGTGRQWQILWKKELELLSSEQQTSFECSDAQNRCVLKQNENITFYTYKINMCTGIIIIIQ